MTKPVKKSFKTWYKGHDKTYIKRKALGYAGWDDDKGTKANIDRFLNAFSHPIVSKNSSILELGCGAGDITIALAENNYSVTGVDISETAISWAKEKAEKAGMNINFMIGNVLDLSCFSDNQFDIVLDSHCLHCIIGDDRKMFLKEAKRVLKKGGLFITGTMCGDFYAINDYENRLVVVREIATRYIGEPDSIIDEINNSGLLVHDYEIFEKENNEDCDELFVWALKE